MDEAKRTYGLLNIGSNVAPIVGGTFAFTFSNSVSSPLPSSITDHWTHTICQLIILISVLGDASMATYYWINRKVAQQEVDGRPQFIRCRCNHDSLTLKNLILSLRESIRYILSSRI